MLCLDPSIWAVMSVAIADIFWVFASEHVLFFPNIFFSLFYWVSGIAARINFDAAYVLVSSFGTLAFWAVGVHCFGRARSWPSEFLFFSFSHYLCRLFLSREMCDPPFPSRVCYRLRFSIIISFAQRTQVRLLMLFLSVHSPLSIFYFFALEIGRFAHVFMGVSISSFSGS